MAKRFLVLIALLMLGFFIAGCAEGDKSSSVTNPTGSVLTPTGSISGVVFDICKNAPVANAVVSVAYSGKVHTVTTGATGAFSFNNVPATEYESDKTWGIYEGAYYVTCDLTKVTGYGYATILPVSVWYSDLGDGSKGSSAASSSSSYLSATIVGGNGSATPVEGLAATLDFEVAALNASISGTIYDLTNTRTATTATVALYKGGSFLATTTASATGAFTFSNLMPTTAYGMPGKTEGPSYNYGYSFMVTKAGYEYASTLGKKTSDADNTCGTIDLYCALGCNEALTGVEINLIANPAKDKTVPYIASVAVGTNADVINGEDVSAAATRASTLVLTFSEAMRTTNTAKNAVDVTSLFAVTVTSNGPNNLFVSSNLDVLDDFTVAWNSAGTALTITPALTSDDDLLDEVIALNPAAAAWTDPTLSISDTGLLTLTVTPTTHLTDASLVPWYAASDKIGAVGTHALDLGFLHAFGEAYQDYFIFATTPATGVGVMAVTIGE